MFQVLLRALVAVPRMGTSHKIRFMVAAVTGSILLVLVHTAHAEPGPGVVIISSKTGQHDQSLATAAAEEHVREASLGEW